MMYKHTDDFGPAIVCRRHFGTGGMHGRLLFQLPAAGLLKGHVLYGSDMPGRRWYRAGNTG